MKSSLSFVICLLLLISMSLSADPVVWPDSIPSWLVSSDQPDQFECYFGTNPNNLQLAEVLSGSETSYNPSGGNEMSWAEHYWWRLDEVASNITRYGVLWDFFSHVPGGMDMGGRRCGC